MPNGPLDERVLVRDDSLVVQTAKGEVITFDRAGRLYSIFLDGRFYRRGVDGTVLEKFTEPDGTTVRRALPPGLARGIETQAVDLASGVPGAAAHVLSVDLESDAGRFRATYAGPVPILPPDAYRSVVLQAVTGCAYDGCVFCGFYKDRGFRVRGEAEFKDHVQRVREAFRAGLSMRRGVFLGDADALGVRTDLLVRFLDVAAGLEQAAQGIRCFGSTFRGPPRGPGEWAELRAASLERVYLGIETANEQLRRRLRKPGSAADALRTVEALKTAGIGVGLIFLLGIGGEAHGAAHVRDSVALCRAADLGEHDIVYLSPLVDSRGELTRADHKRQAEAFRAAIRPGPQVATYDIRHFVY